jgi:hypothetical protein
VITGIASWHGKEVGMNVQRHKTCAWMVMTLNKG